MIKLKLSLLISTTVNHYIQPKLIWDRLHIKLFVLQEVDIISDVICRRNKERSCSLFNSVGTWYLHPHLCCYVKGVETKRHLHCKSFGVTLYCFLLHCIIGYTALNLIIYFFTSIIVFKYNSNADKNNSINSILNRDPNCTISVAYKYIFIYLGVAINGLLSSACVWNT